MEEPISARPTHHLNMGAQKKTVLQDGSGRGREGACSQSQETDFLRWLAPDTHLGPVRCPTSDRAAVSDPMCQADPRCPQTISPSKLGHAPAGEFHSWVILPERPLEVAAGAAILESIGVCVCVRESDESGAEERRREWICTAARRRVS
jgi:hypothetical protein